MKPSPMKVKSENIPKELLSKKQWICWKWIWRDGKFTKPPYDPATGKLASSTDPSTWTPFQVAYSALLFDASYDGIGFMLAGDYVGIDFDSARDPGTSEILGDAKAEIQILNSYTEISPSGRGFKTLVKAQLPKGGHHSGDHGIFNQGRYFCITGHVIPGVSPNIEERQTEVDTLIKKRWPEDFEEQPCNRTPSFNLSLSDQELISKAMNAANGERFKKLWAGDWSEYPSQSEADVVLCMILSFWTGRESSRIDRLFQASGLMRPKWISHGYNERTIGKAISMTSETYNPDEKPSTQGIKTKNGKVNLQHVYDASRMVEEYEMYIKNVGKINFLTGIRPIDSKIRGVTGGEVLTIIARAGSFKTALLQNMLSNYTANSAWGAAFFSLEMPIPSVAERYHEMISGISGREVEAIYRENELQRNVLRREFVEKLSRLYVIPTKVGLKDIPQYLTLIESHYCVKIGVIGIDYLGLLDERGQNEYEIISRVARDVKTLAKDLTLPVVLLAQTSRKGGEGNTEISLDMGRGSGAIEESADFVIGLFQVERENDCPFDPDEPEYDVIAKVLKNRKGARGSMWKLTLDPKNLRLGHEAEPWKAKKSKGANL